MLLTLPVPVPTLLTLRVKLVDEPPPSACSAWKIRILGFVTAPPVRVSVTGNPVLWSDVKISSTVASGAACLSTAKAPVTCGVAIDVPLAMAYMPPGYEDVMDEPGAHRDMKEAAFEYDATTSLLVVAPTLTTVEMQPGELNAFTELLFPAAATVAMPTARRLSTIGLRGSSSQFDE